MRRHTVSAQAIITQTEGLRSDATAEENTKLSGKHHCMIRWLENFAKKTAVSASGRKTAPSPYSILQTTLLGRHSLQACEI